MTKLEFLSKMPFIITHKTWGYSELEFIDFGKGEFRVGVQYRNVDSLKSYATIGSNWDELYRDLSPHMISEGHIKK